MMRGYQSKRGSVGRNFQRISWTVFVFVASFFISDVVDARFPSNNVLIYRPSIDGGRFLTTEQSQGLYKGGFNTGLHLNYAFEPAEVVPATGGGRVGGVVDDFLVGYFTGAIGVTDWLNVGIDVPIVFYETFFNYIHPIASQCVVGAACPQQTKTKMGDVMLAPKIRLLDPDRFNFGLSIQPFILFPTGSGFYQTGYGQFSGGGKLILDVHFNHKFYLAVNVGYHGLQRTNYAPDTAHAIIDDQLLLSTAFNVPIGRNLAFMSEIFGSTLLESPFAYEIQSPFEYVGGFRYSPGLMKRWMFTVGGGTGLDKGWGATGWRGFVQLNYRKSKVVELEEEVEVETPFEEKIVITQKIHFEFDRWNIRPISFPILDDVVAVLNKNPHLRKVRIEGHTDWLGTDAYNQKLSQRRAESVRTYLTQKGIDPNRLTTQGFGESVPIADNNTDIGRAKNRRTEFTVVETQAAQ